MSSGRSRIPWLCALAGVLLAVLGVALAVSRRSSEQARTDRELSTTAGAKAALVGTELERARALALVTARIPPFSELYADTDSLAARIAAVAGPFREINNALAYDHNLYPSRFVEVGYVDVSGQERARVVDGRRTPLSALSADVRAWPSFGQGIGTPVGTAWFTRPFISPTAHIPVTAATTTVKVAGRVRAYVEIELALSALRHVLAQDLPRGDQAEILDASAQPLVHVANRVAPPAAVLRGDLSTWAGLRLAVRVVPEPGLSGGPWYVVASAKAPSVAVLALAPEEAAILVVAALCLIAAGVGARRARRHAARQLTTEQRARAEAERLSRIDALTGLYNRRHIAEMTERELARASREDGAAGVIMLDVDFFKRINDAHGHAAGDAVLVEIARRLQAAVRSWDVVARVGGEEFCVLAPEIEDEIDLLELGERLRASLSERAITLKPGVTIPVTASLGVAVLHSADGSAEYAFDCADRALYAAKRHGRNRVWGFSELDHRDARAEQPECLHIAEALAVACDLREGLTADHSREVAALSAALASALGLGDHDHLRSHLGGWLYDVGKMAIPDRILAKPGKLTDAEWETIRTHPVVGEQLVQSFPELALAAAAVRHHHERWDGTGYPDGRAGRDIPVEARIVAVADAFNAIISDRPYQSARSEADALAELRRCAGSHFDPDVVEALEGLRRHHGRPPAGRSLSSVAH
jgi:diguanylate cyclase (GGDEF)-like protein